MEILDVVIDVSVGMIAVALTGILVVSFVTAGNYSGINLIISGLFVTVLFAVVIFGAFLTLKKMTKK